MIGVDEVGRGAWAGPLCVAAVRLNEPVDGLWDSKKLSAHKRTRLAKDIEKHADIGIAWVSPAELDRVGLAQALRRCFIEAVMQLHPSTDELIIVDGPIDYLSQEGLFSITSVRADSKFASVMAASIVAKVARDSAMVDLALKFPGYGFEKHVGYGTAQHIIALNKQGISTLHRKSFKPIQSFSKPATSNGQNH